MAEVSALRLIEGYASHMERQVRRGDCATVEVSQARVLRMSMNFRVLYYHGESEIGPDPSIFDRL